MGFSGSILAIRGDDSEADQTRSMLVAAAVSTETISPGTDPCLINNLTGSTSHGDHLTTEFILLLDSALDAQVSLAAEIASQLRAIVAVKMMDLASCYQNGQWMSPSTPSDHVVILSLLEVEQPRLATLSDKDFAVLKTVIQSASQILWVMAPAPRPSSSGENAQRRDTINVDPQYSVATGLLRVIRSEYPDKHVVSLLIESDNSPEGPSLTRNRTKFIHQVLRTCFLGNKTIEAEFVVQNGQIAIARAYHETLLDEKRVARTKPQLRAVPWHSGPAVALEIGTPGLLDTLQFREDLTRETPLGPNEVEVKAEVWPISFRDVFIALGRLKESDRMMGYECAGTVTRVGAGCSSAFSEGDRVVMGTFGCMRSHPRAHADAVFRVPDGLSLNEAVAVINPGMTAYHALVNVARLRRGERVLIHSAAGATGQFAVGVAMMLGAEILATVGHDDKKRLLIDRFGIPDDHIFHSRDPSSFARGVKRVTGGRGVDVVLNSLSGDGLLASWECVAPYGRFVEIGKVDIGANSSLPMGGFAKNASFAAIDLVHIINTDKRLTRQLTEKTLELAAAAASDANPAGFVGCPSPLHLYPVSQVEKAFRYMQSAKHSGRILISVQDADAVPVCIVLESPLAPTVSCGWTMCPPVRTAFE
jgi:NADPH:quinone reductase-like Zn-dependent oxidoreductase